METGLFKVGQVWVCYKTWGQGYYAPGDRVTITRISSVAWGDFEWSKGEICINDLAWWLNHFRLDKKYIIKQILDKTEE